ncbi:hypothetical protein QYE76_072014 [Lolium multiflorum]|uniref:Aminotransferase-like plant mobile domain-containing protein n=1 Tax=Lolium multiflorum TaxID=4521 RepID=A0AAD8QI49_LOLMU|nr:hypothetical protein QYE76_072014 [Lolium multiflorum]
MNPCAITALVDRWRPETHSFHLPCGEMTVTLQDVSMILALPIKGEPVCRNTASDGWREAMRDLIGNAPTTEKMSAGAPYSWIQKNFKKCPEGAEDEVVEMYARAYLWWGSERETNHWWGSGFGGGRKPFDAKDSADAGPRVISAKQAWLHCGRSQATKHDAVQDGAKLQSTTAAECHVSVAIAPLAVASWWHSAVPDGVMV